MYWEYILVFWAGCAVGCLGSVFLLHRKYSKLFEKQQEHIEVEQQRVDKLNAFMKMQDRYSR